MAASIGPDVLKALALGARGCLVGKAFLYGLAHSVAKAFLRCRSSGGTRNQLALCGVNDIRQVGPHVGALTAGVAPES
jgi:L-lactate dehydrogenase (cytochrome)